MQYNKILRAQAPIQYMTKLKLPIRENKKSRQIYQMALEMKDIIEYVKQEEIKIINKYNGTVQPDGMIYFGDDEDGVRRANLCVQEIQEFEASDAEWNHEVIKLSEESLVDDAGFTLSPEEIFYLEGFVEFED